MKYWYQAYGLVISGSSQRLPPPVDLPNLVPSAAVTNGTVSACTEAPSSWRASRTPATMLPHWSEPPICNEQPYFRYSCT
ncbi:Uncharacterised protein [Mycobacteroides abscessus subsp. massiliense]|nr:Uncharacterised protein [Mycobacteroides abscessus subsp. massiliense]